MKRTNQRKAKQMTEIKKYNDARDLVSNQNFQKQIAQVLPKHLTPDRMARLAIAAFTRSPKLKQCTQESVFRAMMDASTLGIEPDGRHAHLVPYNDRKKGIVECQLIVDYKGLAALLMESGNVKRIYADVVCENDQYEENMGQVLRHVPNRKSDRGKAYAAYCIIELTNGGQIHQIMGAAEIMQVKNSSPGSKKPGGPWDLWEHEMWKKTVFKRSTKWLSLRATELQKVLEYDDGIALADHSLPALSEPESRLDAIAGDSESADK